MSARTLSTRERRAAAHLADAIAAGYRADLRRDRLAWVEAVAERLAWITHTSLDEALAELAAHHKAIV